MVIPYLNGVISICVSWNKMGKMEVFHIHGATAVSFFLQIKIYSEHMLTYVHLFRLITHMYYDHQLRYHQLARDQTVRPATMSTSSRGLEPKSQQHLLPSFWQYVFFVKFCLPQKSLHADSVHPAAIGEQNSTHTQNELAKIRYKYNGFTSPLSTWACPNQDNSKFPTG